MSKYNNKKLKSSLKAAVLRLDSTVYYELVPEYAYLHRIYSIDRPDKVLGASGINELDAWRTALRRMQNHVIQQLEGC